MKQKPRYTDIPPGTIKEQLAWLRGDDVRTKTDLRGWTGSLPFHLSKEPYEEISQKKEKASK